MYARVNGTRIFFDVEGSALVPDGPVMREKPTLIMLQGGPGFDYCFFGPNHGPVTDVAQIIYIDQRGNGMSDRAPVEECNLEQNADDLAAFIDYLGLERPAVLGMSYGGFVSMTFAARHQDKIGKMILVSTAAKVMPERSLAVFERLGGGVARDAAAAGLFGGDSSDEAMAAFFEHCMPLYALAPPDMDRFARLKGPPDLLGHVIENITPNMDLFPALAKVRCPTLVLSGADDPITTAADMSDIAEALGDNLWRRVCFPEARHFLDQDVPDDYYQALREFLES